MSTLSFLDMPPFLKHPLFLAQAGVNQQPWSVAFEGLSPWLGLGMFALLAAAAWWVYAQWVNEVPGWKRHLMAALRILSALVLVALLTKPVLWRSLQEKVKEPLLVLVDTSDSMNLMDRRDQPADLQRLALAMGKISPDAGVNSNQVNAEDLPANGLSRLDLFKQLAANDRMKLWQRLSAQADLQFYTFGETAFRHPAPPASEEVRNWQGADVMKYFESWQADGEATALGDVLKQALQEPRAQAPGAVLLITDGGQNRGSSAIEAAQIAKEHKASLFVYGVGVTAPLDLRITHVHAQKLAFIRERSEVTARVTAQSLPEQQVMVQLMANGELVEEQPLQLGGDQETIVKFHYSPQVAGEIKLEVAVSPVAGEASENNNISGATMRVTDSKFQVLLIEQEPRWDFRYLLDYLQRDPRLDVKCVMIDGEPGLDQIKDSPFLPKLPEDRETYFKTHVIILGDVDPGDLGQQCMDMLAEWVESGGGMIFLTGSNYNPRSYIGTPLEALLPVVPDSVAPLEWVRQRAPEPFKLELTRQGKDSAYLLMDPDPEQSQKLWEGFQGVRWTAPVSRVKAGAEVLLVDSREDREGRYGKLPVFAMQGYGAGRCVYFGTDETYRWRSRVGEKYYSVLWGQIMQTLSLQLMEGASLLTQLKTDLRQYHVGDRIVIAGKAYEQGFAPLLQPSLEGELTLEGEQEYKQPLALNAVEKNQYQGEFIPDKPGVYRFVTLRDPDGIVSFEVLSRTQEQAQTGMNQKLLAAMAETSGGAFLREEDLTRLPDLIAASAAEVSSYKKVELYHSGGFLTALLGLLFFEWGLRRLNRLK